MSVCVLEREDTTVCVGAVTLKVHLCSARVCVQLLFLSSHTLAHSVLLHRQLFKASLVWLKCKGCS